MLNQTGLENKFSFHNFSNPELKNIKKEVAIFFEKMSFSVEIELLPQKELTLPIVLKTEEPQILIGEKGKTLAEIQYLLKIILRRKIKIEKPFYIELDVNDYKKKKIEYLKELAREVAKEVALTKNEKILPPMSAYERRIVHLELADYPNITTESIGQEPERKIAVKFHPFVSSE